MPAVKDVPVVLVSALGKKEIFALAHRPIESALAGVALIVSKPLGDKEIDQLLRALEGIESGGGIKDPYGNGGS